MGFEPTITDLGGSNSSIDWSAYKNFLDKAFNHTYAMAQYSYAKKYYDCLDNPSKILTIPLTIRSNILKAMICLSKYLGRYETFSRDFKNHGIKWIKPDTFNTFLTIVNNNHKDLKTWYKRSIEILPQNERLYLRFVAMSGLRKGESIKAFNQIIELNRKGKLSEYYNVDLGILEHYKFKWALRNTKNTFITAVSEELIKEISNSKPIAYCNLRRHLANNHLTIMIKPLRSYYATYLNKHGIQSETIDILQGRVSKSVFSRNYLKENLKTLSDQVITILRELETSLTQ